MTSILVTMNEDEVFVARAVGSRRNSKARSNHRAVSARGNDVIQSQASALAEMALAKHTDRWWSGLGKGAEGLRDVGEWEVHAIRHPNYKLAMRAYEREGIYVLVYVEDALSDELPLERPVVCHLLGWAHSSEVRQGCYSRNGMYGGIPFFLMPQDDLHQPGEPQEAVG